MMKSSRRMFCGAAVVTVLACGLVEGSVRLMAQTREPLLGTWALDVGKSTFSNGAPDTRTMKFEQVPAGIRHTTDTVSNQGGFNEQRYRLEYTFKIDGKDYPADVQMPVSTVAFKRIDANTVERSGKYLGAVVETVTYAVSADGKVLTVTQKGNLQGNEVSSVQVFMRQ